MGIIASADVGLQFNFKSSIKCSLVEHVRALLSHHLSNLNTLSPSQPARVIPNA